ncbi:MAG: class I SAM-dependent methyltransferase [Candidatus Bipolaricaulota bacterium]|nr:MAG: class I SAM-dependent methyltransferase [Candidatus Bipolaricaulota bacterium]
MRETDPVAKGTPENYCSRLWAAIYDQYHSGHEAELAFYVSALRGVTGPVLEAACGTGMVLLPLLALGLDAHGFDVSQEMLDVLLAKADASRTEGIERRVTCQDLVNFDYDLRFDAVIIPARSFLHLTTQEEQIGCLRTIHRHLVPSGRLLLNFFTPNLSFVVARTKPDPPFEEFATYTHPVTRKPVKLSFRQVNDPGNQLQRITWRFLYDGRIHDTEMAVRWIYRSEFELLARLTGYGIAHLYGGFSREPYDGTAEMVWELTKS